MFTQLNCYHLYTLYNDTKDHLENMENIWKLLENKQNNRALSYVLFPL